EFYHAGLDHYFRTADAGEASGIDNGAAGAGWVRTGDDFRAYSAATASGGAVPVCRFYGSVSPGPNSHFYTASQEECAGLKALQQSTPDSEKRWNYEGLAFAVALPSTAGCPAGSTSIYRLYNNGFARGADSNHRYTSLQSEYQRLQSVGWGGESIVMCSTSSSSTTSSLSPPTNVTVVNANSQTVGGNAFSSSTQLTVSWAAPTNYTVDHYVISASETVGNSSLSFSATATDTSTTLTGLKSGTSYSVVASACGDAACTEAGSAAAVTGTTSEEYWQLQGSDHTTSGLTKTVSDGNVLFSATRFGPEAGGSTASRIQLYYKSSSSHGPSIAVTSQATNAAISSSYLSFTSFGTTYGLVTPPTPSTLVSEAGGVHAVPLKSGAVRLFFDPLGSDNKSRIMYLDSQDGFVGRDFNNGSATNCSNATDYSDGGGCAPTVIIGVDGDIIRANSKISNARQFKVGFPALTDWRWDQAVGTFMIFTTDSITGCSTYGMNHAYANWDGTNWVVQYDSNGCPKLFKSAQAAFPMHLGGARYKLYYSDPSITTGKPSASMPFLGPKKLIYADGTSSGSVSSVDFEDWESQTQARNVVFLWPDGNQLNDQAEGHIDDYHFLAPTGSLDLQVMYLAITNGTETPFGAAAILLNP
ncbi:MAG: fibronectin type III domain-containing protein, partial [Gallionella sp.]|nr:fibronectin type III domain-containing protein [Gallionella sp.]